MRRSLPFVLLLAGCAAPAREVARLAAPNPPVAPVPVPDDPAPPGEVSPLPPAALPVVASPATRSVIVVTIDGARWQEVFHGVDRDRAIALGLSPDEIVDGRALMPNLHALGDRGVVLGAPGVGAAISASGPNFASLPGYGELLSGRAPTCQRNDCARIADETLLDACRALPGATSANVGVVSSWETIELAASRSRDAFFLSSGRHHVWRAGALRDPTMDALLARSERAFPTPGQLDYRPDRLTSQVALRYVEAARPRCALLGLGDADEHAHLGDYRGYLRALRAFDAFVGDLVGVLAAQGEHGATTTVIVTTDHGRADGFVSHGAKHPESARVWLFAAGGAVPARGEVALAQPAKLADVAPTLRAMLGLPEAPLDDRSGRVLGELSR
ncbi:MAG: hypothetical protein IT374_16820 [Polyangiaceae bacterium]|nr:hypothetical protein [Polyangiaceae bacterium]